MQEVGGGHVHSFRSCAQGTQNRARRAGWAAAGFIGRAAAGFIAVDRRVSAVRLNGRVSEPFRVSFAADVRSTRLALDVTQGELATAARISRAYLASIEVGRANPTLDVAERLAEALGLELRLLAGPIIPEPRQRDLVHARCSAYSHRRLIADGLDCRREVLITDGRYRGWIDVLAYDPLSGRLLIIEIKTTLSDVGAVERQLAWYERNALRVARAYSWNVRFVSSWLLCLASAEIDHAIRINRDALQLAFPLRAPEMRRNPASLEPSSTGRGLALIDPARRRSEWLLPAATDGRRSQAPYRDYADAARRLGAG